MTFPVPYPFACCTLSRSNGWCKERFRVGGHILFSLLDVKCIIFSFIEALDAKGILNMLKRNYIIHRIR